jgi:2-polyprenyl-3-methyl-5-hydroxy-6-metoxy-1,4-benzoquinol methylase
MNRNQKHRQLEDEKLAMEELVNYERALNEVIDSIPSEFKPRIVEGRQRFLLLLKTALPYIVSKQSKILDLGCGAGIMSQVFKKMGHDVFAVDCWKKYPPSHADYVETRLNRERLERCGVHTEDLDIAEEPLPFENDEFDLVLFLDVIEHLHSSPRKILADIRKVLSGGHFDFTNPQLINAKESAFRLDRSKQLYRVELLLSQRLLYRTYS